MEKETVTVTVTKGVGIRAFFKLLIEPEEDIPKDEQTTQGGEEIKLIWSKVWKDITKRGEKITERQISSPKLKSSQAKNVRVKVRNNEQGRSESKENYSEGKDSIEGPEL
mgnify:CR=1 FL=1